MFKISSKAVPEIFKEVAQIVLKLLFILICFFILLFPVMNFKINMESAIFPACEIILIYYFTSFYNLSLWMIFLAGILLDPLYSMPLGTNSLVFLTAHLFFKLAARFFLTKNYLTNFIIFCAYCFFILNLRYLLIFIKNFHSDGYIIILFQYLTTIFSYNLIRLLLDYPLDYFKKMLNKKILHDQLVSRRAFLIGIGKLGLLSFLGVRMFYLQLIKSEEYKTLSDKNRINFVVIPPARGRIYDLEGNILATNQACFQLLIDRNSGVKYLDELALISQILNLSLEKQNYIKQKIKKSSRHAPLMILDQLDWQQVSLIEEQKQKLASIFIDIGYSRFYPFSEVTCHLIGYTGRVNEQEKNEQNIYNVSDFNIGKSGIEKYYEHKLRGEFGYKKVEVNAFGKQVREITNVASKSGADIHLNIDVNLQKQIQPYLNQQGCSAIVMDVTNGNILILAASPVFESNNFSKLSDDYWSSLTNDPYKPLINKTVQNCYPPGSVFKIITVLAALESGIKADKIFFCNGASVLGTNSFRCWNHHGHGALDMLGAIKHSCNIYMYELSRIIGGDKILETARKFGFGSKTGIDLTSESSGFVPSKEWKKQKLKAPWTIGDTFNLAIGQGFTTVTPIQLARFITAIASGKLYTPQIVKNDSELQPKFQQIDIDPQNIKIIQEGLYNTVNITGGTAYYNRILGENRQLAGKTGTSQVQAKTSAKDDLNRESIAWERRNHGLFIGFAPYHSPKYSVTIFVDHGGGGSRAAAPIARKIMSDVLDKYV